MLNREESEGVLCRTRESADAGNDDDHLHLLLLPTVLEYIDFLGLMQLRVLCKNAKDSIDNRHEEIGFWKSACTAFSLYAGIYSFPASTADTVHRIDYKKHFFNYLWNNRQKWAVDDDKNGRDGSDNTSYKVEVACRFRPGELTSEKVCLPLHQFLKIKRHQKAQQSLISNDSKAENKVPSNGEGMFVGEPDPEEFKDPFLGSLMRDPVLLASSNKIVERSVALQCVLRGGRDPFNGKKLSSDMLIPQPDLALRIQSWKQKKLNWDVSLELKELKPLVDESHVNNDLLDALIEVERINNALRKAVHDANHAHETGNHANNAANAEDGGIPAAAADENDPAIDADGNVLNPDELLAQQLQNGNIDVNTLNPFSMAAAVQQQQLQQLEQMAEDFNRKKSEKAGIVNIDGKTSCVSMHVPGSGVRPYHFRCVHEGSASQTSVYTSSGQDAVASVLNGFNSCIMCYGQTGSGKTYTFFGPDGELDATVLDRLNQDCAELPPSSGIVVRACMELLAAREQLLKNGINVSFTAQFVEIYEEQATDLLSGRTVTIRRDSGEISGAVEATLDSLEQVKHTLRTGHERKRFAATAMNDRSSRSHTAFVIQVMQKIDSSKMQTFAGTSTVDGADSDKQISSSSRSSSTAVSQKLLNSSNSDMILKSQLHLVDLAGSERVKRSQATGARMREAVGINSSLLVLGKVISALVHSHRHVPYLESKLTTLLKGAFGGNSKTTVLINCRSDGDHGDETLQSMRFGERCGMISNIMRQTAQSFQSTLQTMDAALAVVQRQLVSLESRGKQHLVSYKNVQRSFNELSKRRDELIAMNSRKESMEKP